MLTDIVFERTRTGTLYLNDTSVALSAGFRRMLALIDGKKTGADLLVAMPQLDHEDLALWTGELTRQHLIAVCGKVPVEDMAFSLTTEMPQVEHGYTIETGTLINDIMADVSRAIGPEPAPAVEERLRRTGRMAAIESVSSHDAMGRAGFFVYPNTAAGLPAQPRVCIAGHLPAQNRVLELLLGRAGCEVALAPTAAAMRAQLYGPRRPHLLMLDADMPRQDGFRALETIANDASLMALRVVLISERGARADLAQAMLLGAAGYISKPLRKDVLDAALPQILGRPVS